MTRSRTGSVLGADWGPLAGLRKKSRRGFWRNLVDEDSEAPWGVTEAMRGLGAGEAIDDEGAEGFVLTVGSVGGLEKEGGKIR